MAPRQTSAKPLDINRLLRWEAVFAAALAVRLLYLATARGVAFLHPLIDADYYDLLGEQLRLGRGLPEGPFWQPPLYPLFLGALYKIAGHTLWAPRVVQSLLGAGCAALVFDVALRLTGRRGLAFAAGLMLALHGPLIFYDGELLPTSLAVFGGALALWLAVHPRQSLPRVAATGAVVGLSSLAVAPMLLLAVPFSLVAASGGRRARALLCAAACAAAVLPATIANYTRGGEWILISANGGINFWIGNNPDVDRTMTIRPGAGWEQLAGEPERRHVQGAGAQDSYFYKKAASFCASQPLSCARNIGHKATLLLLSRELPRNEDLYTVKKDAPVLDVLAARAGGFALPYALLLPLGAAGIVVAWRGRRREDRALLGATAALAITPLLYFVSGRYRAPLAPCLCVLAAMGLGHLAERWRALRGRPRASGGSGSTAQIGPKAKEKTPAKAEPEKPFTAEIAAGLVLLAAVFPVHLPMDDIDFQADMHYAAGGRLARLGQDDLAVEQWTSALTRRPDFYEAAYNMALAQLRLERPRDAVATCDRLLAQRPRDYEARLLRADALLDAGDAGLAKQALEALLRERPDELRAIVALIELAITTGDGPGADALLDRAEALVGPRNEALQELRARAAPLPR